MYTAHRFGHSLSTIFAQLGTNMSIKECANHVKSCS